ncbi:MAG: hypothetical protein LIO53_01345 [Oscillospiraceae bacterium]|nr:hypothetical protein [Oscillospiraceae bacterium]
MRDSMKITVKYQFAYMLLMQAAASGIAFVFGLVAFWYFTNINIAKQVLSIILILVNFAFLYTASKKFAVFDNKPYTPLKPSKIKGVLFGCTIAAVNLILMAVFRLMWINFGTDTGITGVIPTIINILFYYWSFPYNGLMNLNNGLFTIYSAVVMVLAPIAATTAGYIAGCKKINVTEKLDEFMYEKDKED